MTARELTGLTAKLFVQSMCCLNGYVVSSTHKLVPTAVTPASPSAELSLGRGVASLSPCLPIIPSSYLTDIICDAYRTLACRFLEYAISRPHIS